MRNKGYNPTPDDYSGETGYYGNSEAYDSTWSNDGPAAETFVYAAKDYTLQYLIIAAIVVIALIAAAVFAILHFRSVKTPTPAPTNIPIAITTEAPTFTPKPIETALPTVEPTATPEPTPTASELEEEQVYHYYRDFYTGEALAVYEQIEQACRDGETSFSVSMAGSDIADTVYDILYAVRDDHPDFFWLFCSSEWSSVTEQGRESITINLNTTVTKSEIDDVHRSVEATCAPVISALQHATDYDKVLGVFEFLVNQTVYDLDYDAQNYTDLLLQGRAVCSGYAYAAKYLFDELGVHSIWVDGTGSGEAHAWNYVEIEDEWYQIDVTWGDPVNEDGTQTISYAYFCITDEEMGIDHVLDEERLSLYTFPACDSTEADYYMRNGRYLEVYDYDVIRAWVQEDAKNGVKTEFRCANAEVQQQVAELFSSSELLWKLIEGAPVKYSMAWTSKPDNPMYVMSVEFTQD